MADAPTAAPTAPAPTPAAPAAPAAAPAAPTPEINVSSMTPRIHTIDPAKPGSARDRMNKELAKKAGVTPPAEPAKPAAEPKGGDEPQSEPVAGEPPAVVDPKTGKKEKVNPWKLVDEYKAKAAKLEADQLELSKRAIDKTEWTKTQERLASQEKRNKELEDHIRYVDYSKSKEFQEKYQAPYEGAWKRALGDLKDLSIDDGNGVRPLQATDMLDLVNMTLPKAREAAETMFGSMANDVMNHRNKIRELFDEQATALDEARKGGSEREQQRMQQFQAQQKEVQGLLVNGWSKANEKAVSDPAVGRFLKPVEGDVEWNTRLEKATQLSDRAFSENPMVPNLTPEQRQEIVERHAAVRNRSIAYSMLRYENSKLEAKAKELEAKLKEYEQAEPPAGGAAPQPAANGAKGMEGIRAALGKIARPQ